MASCVLDNLDKKILEFIATDARIPFLEIARACNVSGAAIHQRIQKLMETGVLKGTEYIIDPKKLGYGTCAYVSLYLKQPELTEEAVEKLHEIPELVECHYTSGPADLFVKIYAKDNAHLLSIIHDQLQPIGLSRTETIISFREAIKKQMPITDSSSHPAV